MGDPIIEVCTAYTGIPGGWKWALGILIVLTLLSAPEGHAHWKRQKRLDKYFDKKPHKRKSRRW